LTGHVPGFYISSGFQLRICQLWVGFEYTKKYNVNIVKYSYPLNIVIVQEPSNAHVVVMDGL